MLSGLVKTDRIMDLLEAHIPWEELVGSLVRVPTSLPLPLCPIRPSRLLPSPPPPGQDLDKANPTSCLPLNRITDTGENMTFPRTSFVVGKMVLEVTFNLSENCTTI